MGGGNIPRPFGPSLFGTTPNDILQLDYIDLGPSATGDKYVLMLRDDHLDYNWFFSFPDTSAANAANAIIDWCAAFGVPKTLMSDVPTHFRNETISLVEKGLKVPHHFTLPYCPWSNGDIERLGRELVRTFRAVLSELKSKNNEWPDLLPVIQSILNNSQSPQSGNIAPISAFLGRDPTPPISTFLRSNTSTTMTLKSASMEKTVNISLLKD